MLEDQEFEAFAVQEVTTIINSKESMEFSFIKLCGKVIII